MKEAYCNYEMSMLLKEKGFNEYCSGYYKFDKSLGILSKAVINNSALDDDGIDISAPTHQMVLAWLREEHGIIITIDFDEYELTSNNKKVGYGWSIQKIENPTEYFKISTMVYDTYEEACESAIKYVLENLIKK